MTVKENVNPEILLEASKAVIEEPKPRPETPRTGEDDAGVTARETKDRLARDRVALENEERRERERERERGTKVVHKVYFIMKCKNVWCQGYFSL